MSNEVNILKTNLTVPTRILPPLSASAGGGSMSPISVALTRRFSRKCSYQYARGAFVFIVLHHPVPQKAD